MTEEAGTPSQGNTVALAAIAAITGQSEASATEMFYTARQSEVDENLASFEDIGLAIDRLLHAGRTRTCTHAG